MGKSYRKIGLRPENARVETQSRYEQGKQGTAILSRESRNGTQAKQNGREASKEVRKSRG